LGCDSSCRADVLSLEELDRLDLTFIEVMPLGEGKQAAGSRP
jgi:hypothetical protein